MQKPWQNHDNNYAHAMKINKSEDWEREYTLKHVSCKKNYANVEEIANLVPFQHTKWDASSLGRVCLFYHESHPIHDTLNPANIGSTKQECAHWQGIWNRVVFPNLIWIVHLWNCYAILSISCLYMQLIINLSFGIASCQAEHLIKQLCRCVEMLCADVKRNCVAAVI